MPVPRGRKRDTKLYDLLEVSPDASNAQIAKVGRPTRLLFIHR